MRLSAATLDRAFPIAPFPPSNPNAFPFPHSHLRTEYIPAVNDYLKLKNESQLILYQMTAVLKEPLLGILSGSSATTVCGIAIFVDLVAFLLVDFYRAGCLFPSSGPSRYSVSMYSEVRKGAGRTSVVTVSYSSYGVLKGPHVPPPQIRLMAGCTEYSTSCLTYPYPSLMWALDFAQGAISGLSIVRVLRSNQP